MNPSPEDSAAVSMAKVLARKKLVLAKLQQAQNLILEAYQLASPLEGWADEEPRRGPYLRLSDHYDATKELWHEINNAPDPTGYWTP